MKRIILTLMLLAPLILHADLLDRVHLENALQARFFDAFKVYDDKATTIVHLEIHSYNGILPGTNVQNTENMAPDKIELSDISKIKVDIYSTLDKIPDSAKAALLNAAPDLTAKKIELNFKKVQPTALSQTPAQPMEIKDLANIMQHAIANLGEILGLIVGLAFLIFAGMSHLQNLRSLREFRAQFKLLVEAVASNEGSSMPMAMPLPVLQNNRDSLAKNSPEKMETTPFGNWNMNSLRELMADTYWCGLDGYANWLWKNLSESQKGGLLKELPFLRDYCSYFVDSEPMAFSFHAHPYYLEPMSLSGISQADLGDLVKKDLSVWKLLSPMRKQNLPLNLDEKISVLQLPAPKNAPNMQAVKSELRKLQVRPAWGDVTNHDEESIFRNPAIVPQEMRQHIRSIVWLARKDHDFIKRTLEKYDARSLASAWVGPEEVLRELEANIPEKKLKLIYNYRTKLVPNRNSEMYQLLVDEGLKDDAA